VRCLRAADRSRPPGWAASGGWACLWEIAFNLDRTACCVDSEPIEMGFPKVLTNQNALVRCQAEVTLHDHCLSEAFSRALAEGFALDD
jgi:hypothetical protein